MKYKGIIFDLDGTLIKSTIDFVKMKNNMINILEKNGVPKGLLNPTLTTVVILEKSENIWKDTNKAETDLVIVRNTIEEAMNQGEMEAIPLVEEIAGTSNSITKLHNMGYQLAILTRSHHEYAIKALEKLGIKQYFSPILGRGETPKPKPYQEALEHTAMLMKLKMKDLVFVGDHHLDHQSAINAGCAFIGVETGGRGISSWAGDIPTILLKNVSQLPEFLTKNF